MENNRVSIGITAVIAVLFAMVGFFAGRGTAPTSDPIEPASSNSEAVTIVETVVITEPVEVEVTREVEITREVEVTRQVTVPDNAQQATPRNNADNVDFDVFYETWDVIEAQFDGEIPDEDVILHSAIAGSIETLGDQFTRYIPPNVAERIRQDMGGSVSGIGAFVRENDFGDFEIVRPIDGQPADLAGLKPGDIISEVDGESVAGISFDEVILMVRGPEGSEVTLGVLREDEEELLEFTIIRTTFEIPIIESEMLEGNIGYIRLTEFNRNAEESVSSALNELLADEPEGLILDLRDNPGGFLDQSVGVADIFLNQGVVLVERNSSGLNQTFDSFDGDQGETIPLVVLVNAGSASASEIVAGALQDRGRAILIGETTFGKGSVQTVRELSDGAQLRVTIARWYTPDENTIDGQGITPDIEVETPEDLGGEEDPQLQRAIEYLLTGE